MCGICGKLYLTGRQDRIDPPLLRRMLATLRHRGPDDEGTYFSANVGLGHTRLKIIDLNTGRQPMSNEDGTVWVVYNGEIYNYKDLRAWLVTAGHSFRTATDTEVIVHLYEQLGEEFIPQLRGMFSFALWDDRKKVLLLARDRVGIKPLYYCVTPDALVFASEIKAILMDPTIAAEVEPAVLDRFLTYYYVPGNQTLFKNISKLDPGHYLIAKKGQVKVTRYWDLSFSCPKATTKLDESARELTQLLAETVQDHMMSDVPVGVLLSGGVDSTGILSFAMEHTHQTVGTFTIGFDGAQCPDERPFAKIAADQFGTKHYDMTITARDFLNCLPRYLWHMEEPVCEPPAIALYYVSKLARGYVTVLISGEGGDEAFAGYQNYRNTVWLEVIKAALGPLVGPMAKLVSGLSSIKPLRRLGKYAPLMTVPLEKYYYSRTSDPFHFFSRKRDQLYTAAFRAQLTKNKSSRPTDSYFNNVRNLDTLSKMLYVDTKTWLPDDLLTKADKMTMANSLELRVPLLDHRVLEFAASLPWQYKLHGFTTKHILKKVLRDRIPKQLLSRKKTGFPLPYEFWIKHDLRECVSDILTDRKTLERGYFQKSAIADLLTRNYRGQCYSKEIFSLLILELWHRAFIDGQHVVPT